jgi:hypothetical protein
MVSGVLIPSTALSPGGSNLLIIWLGRAERVVRKVDSESREQCKGRDYVGGVYVCMCAVYVCVYSV